MSEIPSPCIDVCKYKLRGHCIGCGMTERQKTEFKGLGGDAERMAFLERLLAQQQALGGKFLGWPMAYRRDCARKGVPCPLDRRGAAA